ncbi:MAG: hypothetical protein ABIT10_10455 [Alteraurantiacibacter sp.]
MSVVPFLKVPVRAIHIVPCGDVDADTCRVIAGGPVPLADYNAAVGPLAMLLRRLEQLQNRSGLPLIVHPECVRRAWGKHRPNINLWGRDEVAEVMSAFGHGGVFDGGNAA